MDGASWARAVFVPYLQPLQPDEGQAAIRDWFRAPHDRAGNLPVFPGIFPTSLRRSFAARGNRRAAQGRKPARPAANTNQSRPFHVRFCLTRI